MPNYILRSGYFFIIFVHNTMLSTSGFRPARDVTDMEMNGVIPTTNDIHDRCEYRT